jgi:hypothetical protein
MKHLIPLILTCFIFSFFAFSFPACKEKDPTIIEGTIFDAVTKKPIKGAFITYAPITTKGELFSGSSRTTDSVGYYRIELAPDRLLSSTTITKSGYEPIGPGFREFPIYKPNEYNLIDIYLDPE